MARRESSTHYADGDEPSAEEVDRALHDAVSALEQKAVPYLLMGGVSSAMFGRSRTTDDVDLFVHEDDAGRVLEVLGAAGFDTDPTELTWLHKAFRHGVLVDVIFRSAGDVVLDDEMLGRGHRRTYRGTDAMLMCPEDLLVIKSLATTEDAVRHWFDALALISHCRLDWDYVLRRARQYGPRRALSLLLYAESVDLPVPADVIETLFHVIHPGAASDEGGRGTR